jgi:hypothetical protein
MKTIEDGSQLIDRIEEENDESSNNNCESSIQNHAENKHETEESVKFTEVLVDHNEIPSVTTPIELLVSDSNINTSSFINNSNDTNLDESKTLSDSATTNTITLTALPNQMIKEHDYEENKNQNLISSCVDSSRISSSSSSSKGSNSENTENTNSLTKFDVDLDSDKHESKLDDEIVKTVTEKTVNTLSNSNSTKTEHFSMMEYAMMNFKECLEK